LIKQLSKFDFTASSYNVLIPTTTTTEEVLIRNDLSPVDIKIILHLLLRLLTRKPELIPNAIQDDGLKPLFSLIKSKGPWKQLTEMVVATIAQDTQYGHSVLASINKNQVVEYNSLLKLKPYHYENGNK